MSSALLTVSRRRSAYDPSFLLETARKARAGAERVLPFVCDLLQPKSILDVGCGTGAWLAVAAELGVTDVMGIDGDYVPTELLEVPPGCFRSCDLSDGFTVDRRFSVALALEVAEHLPEASAPEFVQSLTQSAPAVVFSAAIPGQPGTGHVNLQWPSYWADLFARQGYVGIDCIRPRFWTDESVPYFYRQNTVLYVDGNELAFPPRVRAVRARTNGEIPPLVHPDLYQRDLSFRENALSIVPAMRRAISRRVRTRLGNRIGEIGKS